MMLTKEKINSIKENIDLKEYMSNYISFKGNKAVCPFHDETVPSLSVKDQYFKCFGCGASGDIFNFVMLYDRVGFYDALKILGDKLGVEIDVDESFGELIRLMEKFQRKFTSDISPLLLSVARDRNYDPHFLNKLGAGTVDLYPPHLDEIEMRRAIELELVNNQGYMNGLYYNSISIPFYQNGKVVSFCFYRKNREPKYLYLKSNRVFSKRESWFSPPSFSATSIDHVHIVEGFFDMARLNSIGIDSVIGIGGSIITEQQAVRLIRKFKHFVIMFDGDMAGYQGSMKSATLLESLGGIVTVLELPENTDPDNYIKDQYDINYINSGTWCRFFKKDKTLLDSILANLAKYNDMDVLDRRINFIRSMFPSIPESLIAARIDRRRNEFKLERLNSPNFSNEDELVRATFHGFFDVNSWDLNKFSERNLKFLSLMNKGSSLVELLNVFGDNLTIPPSLSRKELDTISLRYKKVNSIDDMINITKRRFE